jgi:RNA polymerase sigma-70 factor (ECF subfamily)
VLLLRDVLGFTADETARTFETSVQSVNSALQRAHKTLASKLPAVSQERLRSDIGDAALRELVERFVAAWQRADVEGIVSMLTDDVTFSMPPLAAWFSGRDAVRIFFEAQVFARRWRFVESRSNGQLGLACYMWDEASQSYPLSVINVFTFRGDRVAEIAAFLDPAWLDGSGLPPRAP